MKRPLIDLRQAIGLKSHSSTQQKTIIFPHMKTFNSLQDCALGPKHMRPKGDIWYRREGGGGVKRGEDRGA